MPAQTRWELELDRDYAEKWGGEYLDFLEEVTERVFDIAKARTPVRTRELKESWGVSIGSKPDFRRKGKGSLSRIRLLGLGNPLGLTRGVFVHNSAFYASMVEHGTAHSAPRPMIRPALFFARTMTRR